MKNRKINNKLLNQWDKTLSLYFETIKTLIEKNKLISHIVQKQIDKQELGFNIFEIVSDTYYRENFHSDIIKYLLSNEYHPEGQIFLEVFLQCLNLIKPKIITIQDFQNPTIEREKGRIDIRIRDESSKKTIIIENKINNAEDKERQIPRYYEHETKAGYTVIAIVYLTLIDAKKLDKRTWTSKDKKDISPFMIFLSGSKNKKVNLINSWLDLCLKKSNYPDVISTLRQYKAILEHLRTKEMNYEIMKKFYAEVNTPEAYTAALTIRDLLPQLNEFRARNIKEYFLHEGSTFFGEVSSFDWGEKRKAKHWRAKFENPRSFKLNFWIDIICFDTEYHIYFHHKGGKDGAKIKSLLEQLNIIDQFKQSPLKISYVTMFKFPNEEQNMFSFIENVLNQLNTRTNFIY